MAARGIVARHVRTTGPGRSRITQQRVERARVLADASGDHGAGAIRADDGDVIRQVGGRGGDSPPRDGDATNSAEYRDHRPRPDLDGAHYVAGGDTDLHAISEFA